MSRPRVLIFGASGQLGRLCLPVFERLGCEVLGTRSPRSSSGGRLRSVDLARRGDMESVLDDFHPELCLICAAMTHVEGCEADPGAAFRLNVEAPVFIAEKAGRNCRTIFMSTEYVFDGRSGPYKEEDDVNPLNVYGKTKLEGERGVLSASSRNLVVRTTIVYGFQPGGNNSMMQLLDRLSSGRTFKVPADQISSPTYAPDLAEAVARLAELGTSGIIHAAGPEILSRLDFAVKAARLFKLDESLIEGLPTSALDLKARRPLRAGLATSRLKNLLGEAMRGPDAALRDFAVRAGLLP